MRTQILSKKEYKYDQPLSILKKVRQNDPYCLFESSEINQHSGRLSLLGVEPSIEFKGEGQSCTVTLLKERGTQKFESIKAKFAKYINAEAGTSFSLEFPKRVFQDSEDQRFEILCGAQVLRYFLKEFYSNETSYAGLYGALGYNFVYPFEEIQTQKETETPDFHLYFFDTIFLFNHLLNQLSLIALRDTQAEIDAIENQMTLALVEPKQDSAETFAVHTIAIEPEDEVFKQQIMQAKELFAKGELMELVLSRKLSAEVIGDSLALYESYKEINPSPYLYYFDFKEAQLFGASPEIMVRVENNKVTLKPISGTAPRGKNAMEDHERLLALLNSNKEKSELDMLIDLGRNDLSKICKPGITIENYRSIEQYSHVFHTVARLSGELQDERSGIDALIACLNAGTLTGAPKNPAMKYIEEMEHHSRGYYGGCVGYFLLDGEVNTAITIRSAFIKENQLSFLSGATLLYECDPDFELNETKIKAAAFVKALKAFTHETV